MNPIAQQILALAKQLFPNGRAFWVPSQRAGTGQIYTDEWGNWLTDEDGNYLVTEDWSRGFGGWLARLMMAFSGDGANRMGTLERVYTDANSITGHLFPLPNNLLFTDGTYNANDNDCNDYEELFGLQQWGVTSAATPTRAQRMQIIATKMAYPGSAAPRQAASYIQSELQAAGFNVYVYENPNNLTPAEILSVPVGHAFYGSIDYGEADYGEDWFVDGITVIANSVNPAVDNSFDIPPGNFQGVFYLGGATLGSFATIPAIQQTQFRQLVLDLKPANLVGITFINYV